MSALRQAFLKCLENSSNEERQKMQEIVDGLKSSPTPAQRGSSKQPKNASRETAGRPTSPASERSALSNFAGKRGGSSSPNEKPDVVAPAQRSNVAKTKRSRTTDVEERGQAGLLWPVRQDVPVKQRGRSRSTAATSEENFFFRDKLAHPSLPDLLAIPFVLPHECRLIADAPASNFAPTALMDVGQPTGQGAIRRKAVTYRVQVGLDFGTSCTKVLFRRIDVAGRVFPVDFEHRLPGFPSFAIPSIAVFDRTGQLLLGDTAARLLGDAAHQGITGFKMLAAGRYAERYRDGVLDERFRKHIRDLFKSEEACTPELLSAVFIAYVMRRARRCVQRQLAQTDIDLLFNTCVPVDQRQDSQIFAAFCRIAGLAERLEREGSDAETASQWLEKARSIWATTTYDENDKSTRLFVVPEAIAATAGYLSSARKRAGLHALVDIGAGTTDVSIFVISASNKEGLTTSLLGAKSIPLGAAILEELATVALAKAGAASGRKEVFDFLAGRGPHASRARQFILDTVLQMWNGTKQAWTAAYKKDPGESKWTRDAVRVFVSGGGALIPECRTVFSESWQPGWGPYPTAPVPGPDLEVTNTELPFARLCVAYGLTTPRGELGQYVMPDDVPAAAPPQVLRIDYSQDGDQLTPRDKC